MIVFCANCFAQVQQGVVKTRGRMVDGKLVPGEKLSGATISLNFGNVLVSNKQGYFSFKVPKSNTFSLVSASKKGYVLADPEYVKRSFTYSAENPFYVVLEDENQRQADINAATRKVRKTLSAQLAKQEEEIESLKEQKKLNEKEYQDRLAKLYDDQTKSEQLVKEMAERYASTDYDQLDEFNRQVQSYIEEGELQKADSMIRSKGDVEKRISEYHSVVAANKKIRDYLEKSEAGASKTYEELSQDLYYRHEIFLQGFQHDSALACLKLRADLDVTNANAVQDYANLAYNQNYLSESERYYMISLKLFMQKNELPKIADTQKKLAYLYYGRHNDASTRKFLKLALKNYEILFKQDSGIYRASLAEIQGYYGDVFGKSSYYRLSLDNIEQLYQKNPEFYRKKLAIAQRNFARANRWGCIRNYENEYKDKSKCDSSSKYYGLALENFEMLVKLDSNTNRDEIALTQKHLGKLHMDDCDRNYRGYLHDSLGCEISEKYFLLSEKNYEYLSMQNPKVYREALAGTQINLANLYNKRRDNGKSGLYGKKFLENFVILLNQNIDSTYRADLAITLVFAHDVYHDFYFCEKSLRLALENFKMLAVQNPDAYKEKIMMVEERLEKEIRDKAVNLNKMAWGDTTTDVIDSAIILLPNEADFYDTKGEILLRQGKNDEALKMWNKVLELNQDFLKENPEGTDLYNGLKKLGLIK